MPIHGDRISTSADHEDRDFQKKDAANATPTRHFILRFLTGRHDRLTCTVDLYAFEAG